MSIHLGLGLHAVWWQQDMHNGTISISKFWDIIVCLFVSMSVRVYKVGRYQNFHGVPLSAYCVYLSSEDRNRFNRTRETPEHVVKHNRTFKGKKCNLSNEQTDSASASTSPIALNPRKQVSAQHLLNYLSRIRASFSRGWSRSVEAKLISKR